ncbi:hypothetical protein [Kordiimonas sp.]|uniref:hypothetical protein n=1 Tax=Kordiimonas sp. TaxID=1970157 RepID=UPI003A91074D
MESHAREIISLLYSNADWVDLYLLHEEKKLSPGQVAETLLLLQSEGNCDFNGVSAKLTTKGRQWVYENRKEIFFNVARSWARKTSSSEVAIAPNEPYMPDLARLDINFFRNLID